MASFSINDFKIFLFQTFKDNFQSHNITGPEEINDHFDLIGTGLIDSMDFLTMVGELESSHKISLDFSNATGEISTQISFLFQHLHKTDGQLPAVISLLEFKSHMQKLGIQKGDNLLIHSSLYNLNRFENGEQGILDVFKTLVGEEGTIFVPSGNSPAFQNEVFDALTTPVQASLGVFSEFVRLQAGSIRSGNPFDSICGLGKNAFICEKNNIQSHGLDSPWRSMLLLPNMKQVLLGTTFYHASVVHDVETELQVPYRFWKTLNGKTKGTEGLPAAAEYQIYARELGRKFYYDKIRRKEDFKSCLNTIHFERGEVIVSDLKDIYEFMIDLLKEDPEYYLSDS